ASFRQWGLYLASHGYALFAIDYRVATTARKSFPEAVLDVIAAVQFVRGSARGLSIDPQRVGLIRASAGARPPPIAGPAHDKPPFAGRYPDDPFATTSAGVKTLVAVYGIFDLVEQWYEDTSFYPGPEGNHARNLTGKDLFDDQQVYFDASPIRRLSY